MANMSSIIQGRLSQLSMPKIPPLLGICFFAAGVWFTPPPPGLSLQAWHLLGIFLATLIGIVANLLPMGALALIGLAACTITHTLTIKQALSGFSSHIVWLILIAFVLARGFIKTGLGARIAYYFVLNMGKSTLGLAYGLMTTELLLAPFTPSNTARGAGIIYPIVSALSKEYGSSPKEGTERRIGAFLMKLAYQANVITSAMFLTATAGNPLIASLAMKMGVEFTWTSWALAAFVPGLASLLVLPALLYLIYSPQIKKTPEAPAFARKKLSELGPMKYEEWLMLATFGLLLILWVLGSELNVDATVAALVGLAILLSTGVLTWDDVLKEHNAWHTFVWLTTLLTMSNFLTEFGTMSWFSDHMQTFISPFHWISALTILSLLYFYTHYAFASMTAHISALYSPLALLAIAAGAPPMLTVLLMTFFSSLCASITHYGTGTGPVYFGSDYVTIRDWWRIGAIVSVANILIWSFVGGLWWKILGLW
jgi:DASS family divalent anion:Na+ symporter